MTTIQIDISCNGDECGECEFRHKWDCMEFFEPLVFVDGDYKRCPECLSAERRAKGE